MSRDFETDDKVIIRKEFQYDGVDFPIGFRATLGCGDVFGDGYIQLLFDKGIDRGNYAGDIINSWYVPSKYVSFQSLETKVKLQTLLKELMYA